MGKGRRYLPIDQYPIYNNEFDNLMLSSHIFNADKRVNINTRIWTKKNIELEILCYEGNEDGEFYQNGERYECYLKTAKEKVKSVLKEYEQYKAGRVNEGFDEPKEMPTEFLNKKHIYEARLDVLTKELEELQKWLKTFTDKDEEIKNDNLLKYGLLCQGKLRNGILSVLDGQAIIQHKPNLLVIAEGFYKGMSVSDYRKLAEEWRKGTQEKDKEELARVQEQAKLRGVPIPQSVPPRAGMTVRKEDLPPFPEWATNHLKE